MKSNCGGNIIELFGDSLNQSQLFASDKYFYKICYLNINETINIDNLNSYIVYLLSGEIDLVDFKLIDEGDCAQVENKKIELKCLSSIACFLLVGSEKKSINLTSINKNKFSTLKKVEKPWGYEIWITGEHPLYCLKKIFIKKNFKTSLQYHEKKRETNVLFQGEINLHFKKDNSRIDNNNVTSQDIDKIKIASMAVIDVYPNVLHRIEALSDITLLEVSTPDLDDVIRVSDDTNRPSGRIIKEHT